MMDADRKERKPLVELVEKFDEVRGVHLLYHKDYLYMVLVQRCSELINPIVYSNERHLSKLIEECRPHDADAYVIKTIPLPSKLTGGDVSSYGVASIMYYSIKDSPVIKKHHGSMYPTRRSLYSGVSSPPAHNRQH